MRLNHTKSIFAAALVPLVLALAGPAAPSTSAPSTLTNGCSVSARGIPSCGAYMGGAYGANANLGPWESSTARPWACTAPTGGRAISSAVKTAKADAAKNGSPG